MLPKMAAIIIGILCSKPIFLEIFWCSYPKIISSMVELCSYHQEPNVNESHDQRVLSSCHELSIFTPWHLDNHHDCVPISDALSMLFSLLGVHLKPQIWTYRNPSTCNTPCVLFLDAIWHLWKADRLIVWHNSSVWIVTWRYKLTYNSLTYWA